MFDKMFYQCSLNNTNELKRMIVKIVKKQLGYKETLLYMSEIYYELRVMLTGSRVVVLHQRA